MAAPSNNTRRPSYITPNNTHQRAPVLQVRAALGAITSLRTSMLANDALTPLTAPSGSAGNLTLYFFSKGLFIEFQGFKLDP